MEQPAHPSFADQLQRFRARTSAQHHHFQALILPGTRQAVTAALLIGALEPERVAFLLTEQTRTLPADVADLLGCSAATWLTPPGDHAAPDRVYTGLKQVLADWHDLPPTVIAVDVTGGFAPMSVGLAKAAHVLRLTTVYVRSDHAQAGGRFLPVPGTQRLEFPPDPYAVFGDLEAQEAQRLFAAHDYSGAQRIFAELGQRVPDPDNQPYRAYTQLAAAYAAWDNFDWNAAAAALSALLAAPLPANLEADAARLRAQYTALHQLDTDQARWERKPNLALLADLERVLPLLGTLDANAQRREAQGRYDVAALFHYRCLELMSQHRLATWGLLTERPDYAAILKRQPDLDQRYRRIERTLFPRDRGLPYAGQAISLFNGYMLLAALADPLVQGFSLPQIRKRTAARNKSMLAHGFRLITQVEYQEFQAVVNEMLERFFTVMRADRAAWAHTYAFVRPFTPTEA